MRLAAAVLILLTATAVAQPGMTPPTTQPIGPQPVYAPQQPMYGQPMSAPPAPAPRKSESTATLLALGTTAAGLGTIYLGAQGNNGGLAWAGVAITLIGPSAGHIYAGETGHAAQLSLLRIGGFATFVYGLVQATTRTDCYDSYACDDPNDGEGAMWLGGAVVVGATLYDFVDASKAARRANRKAERAWQVTPMMMPASGVRSPGVGIAGTF
jgi:hypothetical protein